VLQVVFFMSFAWRAAFSLPGRWSQLGAAVTNRPAL
jgi:hypothetical protein